jgi:hypothetical protein
MTDKWYTKTHTHTCAECENEDVTVLWKLGVHTDRKVTANRPVIIIKNKKEKIYIIVDVAIHVQKCHAKGSRKEAKIQEFMHRKTMNMEHAMSDYTSNNWSH